MGDTTGRFVPARRKRGRPGLATLLPAVLVIAWICCVAPRGFADTLSISGVITQSTQDGTGPAVNNLALNNISDGDPFTITVQFTGSFTSPGTYALPAATVLFSDPSTPAIESAFGSFLCAGQNTLACVTVTADGSAFDFSMFACLTTGSGCLTGNELALNFQIGSLNGSNISAQTISGFLPLDLLEDDGVTDIQGSITTYSSAGGTGTNPVPEPSAWLLLASLTPWILRSLRRPLRGTSTLVKQ